MTLVAPTPRRNHATFDVRPDTNDTALVLGIVAEDEYGLGKLDLRGWAIDVGAHIGTVAIALAMDNPDLQVVAVEALPENVEVMRRSVALNSLGRRVHVIPAAAGAEGEVEVPITYGWSRSLNQPDGWVHSSRFIGGMVPANETSTTIVCPAVSLGAILERYGIDDVALMKIDCEGCEWFFLDSPAISRVQRIVGEVHVGSHGDHARLHALLDPTHDLTIDSPEPVSLFEAVRRG
jgi:FkbM family methyltransferase